MFHRIDKMTANFDTTLLRLNSRAAINRKLSEILKKGAVVVNQSVVLLTYLARACRTENERGVRVWNAARHAHSTQELNDMRAPEVAQKTDGSARNGS